MTNKIVFMFAALLALPAWSGPEVLAPERALKAALEESGSQGVVVRIDNRTGIPDFVQRGSEPLAKARNAEHAARAKSAVDFLQRHAKAYRLSNPSDELRLAQAKTDALGQHHYLLQQYLRDVPIRGAQAKAHFVGDELRVLTARTIATPHFINTAPSLKSEAARRFVHGQFAGKAEVGEPKLEIRRVEDMYRLTYAVESLVHGINRWQTVLDAHTGEVLLHYLDHHDGEVQASGLDMQNTVRPFTAWQENGRYHMVDVTTPVDNDNENPLMRRSSYGDTYIIDFHSTKGDKSSISSSTYSNAGWDPLAVSAIHNAQRAFHYFRDTHGHSGVDDNDANLMVGIHYGENYDNAFWNGKWLVFGDGGKTFAYLAACLDVVGHELAHGVIQHTAGLVYENQSGALNESFADVFGAMIERRNWTVGEGCTNPQPGYLRNMQDPHKGLSSQPKHMDEYAYLPNTKEGDWGGVHINSGIPNRAAYLLIEGLSREGLGNSIGLVKAEALYFRALSTYLVSSSQFLDLRRALLLAADDLFAADASVNLAVRTAFDSVGVVEQEAAKTSTDAAGKLSASASTLDFEEVIVGKSRSLALRFSNSGDTTVTVSGFTASEGFTHSFEPMRIPAGSVMEGSVTFQSTTSGTWSGELTVHTDDGESDTTVTLRAVAVTSTQTAATGDAQEIESGGGVALWLLMFFPLIHRYRRRGAAWLMARA